MPWRLILSLTTVAPLAPAPGMVPGFVDGAHLHELCRDKGPDAKGGDAICVGYVVGAVDQILARQARRPPAGRTVCLPSGITADQLAATVDSYLEADPSLRRQAAAAVVLKALDLSFPCRPAVRQR